MGEVPDFGFGADFAVVVYYCCFVDKVVLGGLGWRRTRVARGGCGLWC